MKRILLLGLIIFAMLSCRKEPEMYHHLVPRPFSIKPYRGNFILTDKIKIKTSASINGSEEVAKLLASGMNTVLGWTIPIINSDEEKGTLICLSKIHPKNKLGKEGYALTVTSDSIIIQANDAAGLFYGAQTLLQSILPYMEEVRKNSLLEMPCVEIQDKPRFEWRGMHLDVSRHFYDVAFIKKYIDILAFHKLNVFHWHLTDDQGWRIEIKKYPKLTEIGAWREGIAEPFKTYEIKPYTDASKPKYGGYYTHEQIRDVVRYAQERFITVIPEIEMPGHSFAALYAYPELSCSGKPWKKPDSVAFEFSDPYCAGNENTFEFFENVLSEVIELFPSPYIHIGGDECKKTPWKECAKCNQRMKDEGINYVEELQSYFIKRIEKYVHSKGKKIIGWDEILEGGMDTSAVVMCWQNEKQGIEGAKKNHKVIMTPSQYLYFKSAYQDDPSTVTLRQTYEYNPVPDALTDDEQKMIVGVQGCIWTEPIHTDSLVLVHLLPRLAVLSEIAWLQYEKQNYTTFIENMSVQYQRYDGMGWNYYIHMPSGLDNDIYYGNDFSVSLSSEIPGMEIRYTTNGDIPSLRSPLYSAPIKVGENTVLNAKSFMSNGKSSSMKTGTYRKVTLTEPCEVKDLTPGVKLTTRSGVINTLDNIETLIKTGEGISKTIAIPDSMKGDYYALQFKGYIKIPNEGVYTFFLKSDDGSRLYLNDSLVVDHDGIHGAGEVYQKVALEAGYHQLKVDYFEGNYGQSLLISVEGPSISKQEISEEMLFH